MVNVAKDVLWPTDPNILIRVAFLYVGQGDSQVVIIRDGTAYKTLVVDINRDKEGNGGISVPRLMKDLLAHQDGRLDVFVNTHPHNDHLDDITELSESVDIQEIWHSGHVPGKQHQDSFKELKAVVKKVKKKYGEEAEIELEGSRSAKSIGDAEYYVLAPAAHVKDDISDESDDTRYRRIHEQCAVLKFGKGDTWVMLTGDADRDAWEKHITEYHKKRLPAQILSAPHHGSKTFFRYDDDDPYLDALQAIAPTYVVISAPKSSESPHEHPHDDAVKFYEDQVGADNVLHSGKNRESYICDIFDDGTFHIQADTLLVDEYGKDESTATNSKNSNIGWLAPAIAPRTKIDQRPMGSNE